ncbi:hypothetical protein [Anoxybacillus suryakundensis]|uniref:Uncharacterized protein n=1 Tax=Anoxybacillus suryakundensis TaxID=1325335 RepID=A0A0K6GKY9_9BACL|nr:hypothetical protein [Anoxybacillus suryakundensis]CUA79414.1 hypothetical protein Ga0061060_10410 [Anoxybacillus suryakundensis]
MNLMKLEMMDATARIAEALQMRGVFVEVQSDFIVLTEGNTQTDIHKVRELLHKLGIPTMWQKNKFQVLVTRVPIAIMKRIINAPGQSFPISMNIYHHKWKSFVQRRFGIKVNALDLDANMAMFVKSLNLAGITALAGYNGHHRYEPNVQLSGVFQGAWFEVIQEKYLNNCSLHYKWTVHYGTQSGACIVAHKEENENWDMNKIYQDTVQMAQILQTHAEEIRKWKRTTFKRKGEMKEQAKQFVENGDFAKLVEWMKDKMQKKAY